MISYCLLLFIDIYYYSYYFFGGKAQQNKYIYIYIGKITHKGTTIKNKK